MKVFLHIGMPKTGSTTIQRALLRNRSTLLNSGFYFPFPTDYFYGLVTGSSLGPKIVPPSNCHTVIVSDERLFNRVRSTVVAQRIVDALREISTDVKLIAYVRREDEVFVSTYFTKLLMGRTEKLTDLPLHPVKIYKRLISWEESLGRKNIALRRFGTPYLHNGLVADFANWVGIDIPLVEGRQPRAFNRSPRTDVLEIIRLLNERQHGRFDRHALKMIAEAGGFGQPVGLSEEKRRNLVEQAMAGSAKLSKRYFKGEAIFTHPFLDDEPHWPQISIEQVAKIADEIASICDVKLGSAPTDLDSSLMWVGELAKRHARRLRE